MLVLYSCPIVKKSLVIQALYTTFNTNDGNEYIVALTSSSLIVYIVDEENATPSVLCSTNLFANARSIAKIESLKTNEQYFALLSDSGILTVIKFDITTQQWTSVFSQPFGRPGARRAIPNEYLSVDYQMRIIVLSAIQENYIIYKTETDNNLTGEETFKISNVSYNSTNDPFILAMTCLDSNFSDPLSAFLTIDLQHQRSIQINRFELENNIIHVIETIKVANTAHSIFPLPSSLTSNSFAPFIVCSSGEISLYDSFKLVSNLKLPRRFDLDPDSQITVNKIVSFQMSTELLLLLQLNTGDLFKLTINTNNQLEIYYLRLLPLASSIVILPSGTLVLFSSSSENNVYTFASLGNDLPIVNVTEKLFPVPTETLVYSNSFSGLLPSTCMQTVNALGDSLYNQIYVGSGSRGSSKLNILRYGYPINEIAGSTLSNQCTNIWSISENYSTGNHDYIIISFVNSTMLLHVDSSIEEYTVDGFLYNEPTIYANTLQNNMLLQVTSKGWILLSINKSAPTQKWSPAPGRRVVDAVSTKDKVYICLNGGLIQCFSLNNDIELDLIYEVNLKVDITQIAIENSHTDKQIAGILAVLTVNNQVLVLSTNDKLSVVAKHELVNKCIAKSLSIYLGALVYKLHILIGMADGKFSVLYYDSAARTFLKQVYTFRAGTTSVSFKNFKLNFTNLASLAYNSHAKRSISTNSLVDCVVVISDQLWVFNNVTSTSPMQRLIHDSPLISVSFFNNHTISNSLIGVSKTSLQILSTTPIDPFNHFSKSTIGLNYTPRSIIILPGSTSASTMLFDKQTSQMPFDIAHGCVLAVIQYDVQVASMQKIQQMIEEHTNYVKQYANSAIAHSNGSSLSNDSEEADEQHNYERLSGEELQTIQQSIGKYKQKTSAGCISFIQPANRQRVDLHFAEDEIPTCGCFGYLNGKPSLVVAVAYKPSASFDTCVNARIQIYQNLSTSNVCEWTLQNETPVEYPVRAMCPYPAVNGILVGVKNLLRLYKFGKSHLLRHCQYNNLPVTINFIKKACIQSTSHTLTFSSEEQLCCSDGNFFISDIRQGLHAISYNPESNLFFITCEQLIPRWITCAEALDAHTIAACDKFGGFFVSRLSEKVSVMASNLYKNVNDIRSDAAYLQNRINKFTKICEFNLHSVGTSMQKCLIANGASQILLINTIESDLIAMLPIVDKIEIQFFTELQQLLRKTYSNFTGNSHVFYRSASFAVANVIDGDLIQSYSTLPAAKQLEVAQKLDKTPDDIIKLINILTLRIL